MCFQQLALGLSARSYSLTGCFGDFLNFNYLTSLTILPEISYYYFLSFATPHRKKAASPDGDKEIFKGNKNNHIAKFLKSKIHENNQTKS